MHSLFSDVAVLFRYAHKIQNTGQNLKQTYSQLIVFFHIVHSLHKNNASFHLYLLHCYQEIFLVSRD